MKSAIKAQGVDASRFDLIPQDMETPVAAKATVQKSMMLQDIEAPVAAKATEARRKCLHAHQLLQLLSGELGIIKRKVRGAHVRRRQVQLVLLQACVQVGKGIIISPAAGVQL